MNLNNIIIREATNEYESLALALQALAAAKKIKFDYHDLAAALGLSFTAISTSAEKNPGWWTTYARDAFLVPAGQLFGIELRPIHHPSVGIDMLAADEFAIHFQQSYIPLIQQALLNNQPVIAWQGWPDFHWPFWGIITAQTENQLLGTTLWADGKLLPLTKPALQCYMVERCQPEIPAPGHLFKKAVHHADQYMNHAPYAHNLPNAPSPDIVTGPAAFDAWEKWLDDDNFGNPQEDQSWNEHRQHAEFISASRASAARFLDRNRSGPINNQNQIVGEAISSCRSLVNRLADSCDPETVKKLFATRQGRQTLLQSIHAAEADDRKLALNIERLAS
ncbi:MAG: hypothetical protein ACYTF1_03530 [Planctomycetota bacterium]|jgi:hypothetical protein